MTWEQKLEAMESHCAERLKAGIERSLLHESLVKVLAAELPPEAKPQRISEVAFKILDAAEERSRKAVV